MIPTHRSRPRPGTLSNNLQKMSRGQQRGRRGPKATRRRLAPGVWKMNAEIWNKQDIKIAETGEKPMVTCIRRVFQWGVPLVVLAATPAEMPAQGY